MPYEVPDRAALERAYKLDTELTDAIEHAGEQEALRVLHEATARHRRPDGSYRFENRFRYLICAS